MALKKVIIIPSRLESSRLPQKALIEIVGYPMIIHVLKRCKLAKEIDEVFVATDSKLIEREVKKYNGKVIMTSSDHKTGTDRIAEASKKIDADIIINVQGDEVLLDPNHIDQLCKLMDKNEDINVAILVNEYNTKNNPSAIKTVLNEYNEVMYFSRSDIPSTARSSQVKFLKAYHIIPFRKKFLIEYSNWAPSKLESIEFNEYLRILEKGYKIKALEVESDAISIDTEEDLSIAKTLFLKDKFIKKYN